MLKTVDGDDGNFFVEKKISVLLSFAKRSAKLFGVSAADREAFGGLETVKRYTEEAATTARIATLGK